MQCPECGLYVEDDEKECPRCYRVFRQSVRELDDETDDDLIELGEDEDAEDDEVHPYQLPLALASILFGLWGNWTLGITAVIGLFVGIRVLEMHGRAQVRRVAMGGIAVSVITLALVIPRLFSLTPFFAAKKTQLQPGCPTNLYTVARAITTYAMDHNGMLPTGEQVWSEISYPTGMLICPERPSTANGYGYNLALASVPLSRLTDPQHVPLVADCDNPTHCIVSLYDLAMRHAQQELPYDAGVNIAFTDGHVELITRRDNITLMPALTPGLIIPSAAPIDPTALQAGSAVNIQGASATNTTIVTPVATPAPVPAIPPAAPPQ